MNTPGRAFRSAMPFGVYDRLNEIWPQYQEQGVGAVVVLTEPQEYLVKAQRDLPAFYRSQGLQVLHLPVPDFDVPADRAAFEHGLQQASQWLAEGVSLAVHCNAGIGRTGIFLACLGKRQLGLEGKDAISWIRQFIPEALENPLQEAFVVAYA
ncbi:MAG: dual specificity protein phosphatase family protein [Anaerolineales bacterium]|nr:dual specificity protein phosphatase family protein [Anaerolineales bacterium]